VELVTDSTVRYLRAWDVPIAGISRLSERPVVFEVDSTEKRLVVRTEVLIIEIARDSGALQIRRRGGSTLLDEINPARRIGNTIVLERRLGADERFSGLMAGMAMRDTVVQATRLRLLSTLGYGEVFPGVREGVFDFGKSGPGKMRIELRSPAYLEQILTADAAPKGILEEWANYLEDSFELKAYFLEPLKAGVLPSQATRLDGAFDSWAGFERWFRRLSAASVSAVLYPAWDTAKLPPEPSPLRERSGQIISLFPLIIDSERLTAAERLFRKNWLPYLTTYAREAYDRGFPLLRPLAMQFPRDPRLRGVDDTIMLGDELLLVPAFSESLEREVELPMGTWTDWYSGRLYPGRQRAALQLPATRLPIFAKNGSIVPFDPLAPHRRMELHYFPNIGGEFFLWEPEMEQNSQFHASPAGDAIRLEIESKVTRTYEWVVRHMNEPKAVTEGSRAFRRCGSADDLAPDSWFYDATRRELRVVLRGDPGEDRIVMVAFPPK
jgi:hypothetical protein